MRKSNIIKSAFISLVVSLCMLVLFILLKAKLGISLPSYSVILIFVLTNTVTLQYLGRRSKDSKSKDK